MELMIPLDASARDPLYEQIYAYIKEEVRSGRFTPGERLPSTRILAANLKVSRSTTQMAYDQLLSEGYIESVPCRGYFVCGIEGLVRAGGGTPAPVGAPPTAREEWTVDFSIRGVDLGHFPFNTWRKLCRNALADDNREIFSAGERQGDAALRSAISDYLHLARGVKAGPEQILIGAGNEYLLMQLSQILGGESVLAMERYTYKQAWRVLTGLGHPVKPVAMDEGGMDAAGLRQSGASAAYVMPSHQYPTGSVMPIKRRHELLAWAYEAPGRYLIEDDYDSEFRYKGKPIPSLQGLDGGERVIYMGTFSRSIAPAIRVGFMVLPGPLLKVYREKAGFYTSAVSRIDQSILTQFLVRGHYERHLNRMRGIYKAKHDRLLAALRPLEGDFILHGEGAGLHILLTSRKGLGEEELIARAGEAGVRVYGMSAFSIAQDGQENAYAGTVMLGFSTLSEEAIDRGVALLLDAWK